MAEKENKDNGFESLDEDQNIVSEFWSFMKENKKFWLIPIIVILLVMGLLILFGGTSAAPFIYALF
ncbi:MAG: hypothetical protein A2020_10880 [Lentisphaerae bacterium GWF2_45_14]|nr:MAG: hypothetical protein A2020_10880 [Lentisphaerae bacterium GWF2_45_14]